MKKLMLMCCAIVLMFGSVQAQKYFTKAGEITFYSEAPMEKIEATNSSATSVMDLESGRMEFAVLIKAFQFEKALMQEHFNENYMESSTFPKATFKGQITNLGSIDFSKDGTYEANIKGDMTIHGVTQAIETTGQFVVNGEQLSGTSNFVVLVADYGIEIPAVVKENIAKEVEIKVNCNYQELKSKS